MIIIMNNLYKSTFMDWELLQFSEGYVFKTFLWLEIVCVADIGQGLWFHLITTHYLQVVFL